MIRVHRLVGEVHTTQEGIESVRLPEGAERAWIRAVDPGPEEVAALVERLGLHELAIEDALSEGHPPKLEDFGEHLFLIAHTPIFDEDERLSRKISLFLGATWIVSIQRAPLEPLDELEERVQREPVRFLQAPERVAHGILDHMVDGFERRVDGLADRCDALEEGVLGDPQRDALATILALRHEAAHLARLIRAQRDVSQAISRTNHPVLSARITPYFRDAYDHLLRVHDLLEGVRESLSVIRDGYLSAVNNRLAETMRVLTAIATVMMPLTLVAGIYGMNFDVMPFLHEPMGFWGTIGFMALLGAGMFAWFRRRRWW